MPLVSEFKKRITKIVKSVPEGKLVSYGQVALMAGVPRGARQVGWILNKLESGTDVPWWMVINNEGRISIKGAWVNAENQKVMIEREDIKVSKDYDVDLDKFRWRPSQDQLNSLELDSEYKDRLLERLLYLRGWWAKQDSNLRPLQCHCNALTN